MEDQSWKAYFSHQSPPKPYLTKIILDLKKRELDRPTFVCLQCTKESTSQQAMASHCKEHVQVVMPKGTVEHIKYYLDHTYFFLCSDAQSKVPWPIYKIIFAYAGNPSMLQLACLVRDNHNRIALMTTPIGVKPDIDLALWLCPALHTSDDSTEAGSDDNLVARFNKYC
ncbi:hypothetical protein SORBI_3010G135700 [Sorghum bicolor]|uniref:Uncharacterized protein n=1 Tax=Sorghum bicolor TaxID=4558 RepID=A0A194YJ05_SORBI|nr:hypothetical protein SORBI_3010G135700 [Sorghum bicolor]